MGNKEATTTSIISAEESRTDLPSRMTIIVAARGRVIKIMLDGALSWVIITLDATTHSRAVTSDINSILNMTKDITFLNQNKK